MVRTAPSPAGALRPPAGDGEERWRALLGPLLDRVEVQQRLGLGAADVRTMEAGGRLLALPTESGDVVFPAFQFGPDGKVEPTIGRVLAILLPVVVTPYTVASWLRSPRDDLGRQTPLDWLAAGHDPDQVIAAAELTAARLAL
jgi:hypothetical protein